MTATIQGFNLSPLQRRLWRLGKAGGSYRAACTVLIEGTLDPQVLRQAADQVAQRHELLRVRFDRLSGMELPVQVVDSRGGVEWWSEELDGATPDGLVSTELAVSADLRSGPLLRVGLLRDRPDRHVMVLGLPALLADAGSLAVLVREIAAAYAAVEQGHAPDATEAGVRYVQFASWLDHQLVAPEEEEGPRFWRDRFPEPARALRFPFERPAAGSFRGALVRGSLPARVVAGMSALAAAEGARAEEVLLAAWQVLAGRCAGEEEGVVAEVVAGRDYEVLEDALGLFARALPMPFRLSSGLSFRALLGQLTELRRDACNWSEYYLWSEGGQPSGDGPSFPSVGFELEGGDGSWRTGGLALTLLRCCAWVDRFKIKLTARVEDGAIAFAVEYDASRFDGDEMTRLARRLERLVESAVEDPGRPVSALGMLPDAERQAVLCDLQPAGQPGGRESFVEIFAAQAAATPDAPALVFESVQLSYRELEERANRLARHLRTLGAQRGTLVGIALERSHQVVVALLAVLKAGAAYVVLEPAQPRQRMAAMLEDSGAALLVSEEAVLPRLPADDRVAVLLDRDLGRIDAESAEDPGIRPAPPDLAYVVFTSGSTGRPKGVAVEHRHLKSYLKGCTAALDLPVPASFATVSTFAADLGNTALFPSLASGGCLHVISQERLADPDALGEYVSRRHIDCLKIVPSHLEAMLGAVRPEQVLPRRRLILGGEALRPALAKRLAELAPGCAIYNHYGPSETTVGVLTHHVDAAALDPRCVTVPLGRPIAGARVYLLDSQLEPVPLWQPGEVFIGGESVTRGYLGQPRQTARVFLPDPYSPEPGARMYRAGDLARLLPDGAIEFLGRADSQVKFHGFRVELGEIRAVLNRHAQIRDSVVRMAQDEDGRDVLIAYYVSRHELEVGELRWLLEQEVPEETIPNFFVHLRRLPLTLNGKVNLEALPPLAEIRKLRTQQLQPPRTPTEEIVAGIWSEVLRVQSLGRQSDFFELGGHSLLATQVVSRIRQTFGVEVPLRALFEVPTVAALAERVDALAHAASAADRPPLTAGERSGPVEPSFAQERLWFMHRLDPGSPAYNMPVARRFAGPLDREALCRTLDELVRRHESLRTCFAEIDGRPFQVIGPPRPVPLPRIDLRGLPAEAREAALRAQAWEESQRPFDLARGPLLRVTLVELAAEDHAVFFTLHHVVSDGWSLGVLIREVMTLYGAFREGRPSPLPELPIQYGDFARWQRRWLRDEVLASALSYWRRQLGHLPEPMSLPCDRPRPARPTFEGEEHAFELSPELTGKLRALSRSENATLFMTLLTAFEVLLLRHTGQEDVVVGTDIAGRNQIELEGLIGFFVNNLVLRTDLSGNPQFRELLQRVRRTTLDAYAHQDLPFELLVQELRPKRELNRTPLFQVLFVLQNAPLGELRLPDLELRPIGAGRSLSKFDLSVFLRERGDHLAGRFIYKPALFDTATVQRLARHYLRILEDAATRPDEPIDQLQMLSEEERRDQSLQRSGRRDARLQKLRTVRRRTVDPDAIQLVETGPLVEGQRTPLLIRPSSDGVEVEEWARSHRPFVKENLESRGAILFRGFPVDSVAAFERLATALSEELFSEYGDLPRESEGERVYQSTPYPADKTILFHNESSHLHRWPLRQIFYCHTAARERGETPIVDCRRVYQELDAEIRAEFEAKGILYVRNFVEELDVSWQEFFKTDDRGVVEQFCRQAGIDCEWTGKRLRTRRLSPAVVRHPRTGEPVFFNQIQLHHIACLDPDVRRSMLALFGEDELPRNAYFGDGSRIDDEVVQRIVDLYWRLAVVFPWQEKDVLLLDNMLVAHARNPFTGPRKIAVAMADLVYAQDLAAV